MQLRRGYARGGGGGKNPEEDGDVAARAGPAHRINGKITARQIRLVIVDESSSGGSANPDDDDDDDDDDGGDDDADISGGGGGGGGAANAKGGAKRHEVISTMVALRRAKEAGLDLVEVNPRAVPPVCRLMAGWWWQVNDELRLTRE